VLVLVIDVSFIKKYSDASARLGIKQEWLIILRHTWESNTILIILRQPTNETSKSLKTLCMSSDDISPIEVKMQHLHVF